MIADYSRTALMRFLDILEEKGLAKSNTVIGRRVACTKILDDLSSEEESDVRRIDVETAVKKFVNKNPGDLSPRTLGEYRRRIQRTIKDFVRYNEDPESFKPIGRAGTTNREARRNGQQVRSDDANDRSKPQSSAPVPTSGLSLSYPLRPDFLAQVVVPRDLKLNEARRLSAFVMTLSPEYEPETTNGGGKS